METTISPDNAASQALFKRAFDRLDANCTTRTLFARDVHFAGQHEDEVLYRAGPFTVSHLEEELKEHV
jgi:L-2,4-diaminobutyric acid acetyltransferase